ncbi:MAG: hypothetical protein MI746_04985 [Pseudomonadales bacterium]|nr:hypothetical protein [Pseudomonadales bacterium]
MKAAKAIGMGVGAVVVIAVFGWVSTAPYLSNQGLGRLPGVIIGGEITPSPDDFTPLNDLHDGPLMMKQAGFPPVVVYLSWVGTPDGVITATRPDGGYWAQRVRDRGGDGWLRIGDKTYQMEAIEIFGDERISMMQQWAGPGRSLDVSSSPGVEPLRDWEVFFWVPKS